MTEYIIIWQDPHTHERVTRPVVFKYRETEDECFARYLWAVKFIHGDNVRVAILPINDDK